MSLKLLEQTDFMSEGLLEKIPARSGPGEIYKVGPHLLVCADSENPVVIARCLQEMNTTAVRLVMTDPPYKQQTKGGNQEFIPRRKTAEKSWDTLRDADISDFDPSTFLSILPLWFGYQHMQKDSWQGIKTLSAFIYTNQLLLPNYLGWALMNSCLFDLITWTKQTPVPYGGTFYMDAEYQLWIKKNALWQDSKAEPNANRSRVQSYTRSEIVRRGHPTPKPIPMLLNQMLLTSKVGEVVADPYGGSGTTLVAAHLCNRIGIYIEREPRWVDIALNWMEILLQTKAVRIGHTEIAASLPDAGNLSGTARPSATIKNLFGKGESG